MDNLCQPKGAKHWLMMTDYPDFQFQVFNVKPDHVDPRVQFDIISAWVMKGKRSDSSDMTELMFQSWYLLFEEIGWDVLREVNQFYLKATPSYGNQDYTINYHIQNLCRYAKLDLSEYFKWWTYNVWQATTNHCRKYPPMKSSLTDRFNEGIYFLTMYEWITRRFSK